jgi:hypothetical protein
LSHHHRRVSANQEAQIEDRGRKDKAVADVEIQIGSQTEESLQEKKSALGYRNVGPL